MQKPNQSNEKKYHKFEYYGNIAIKVELEKLDFIVAIKKKLFILICYEIILMEVPRRSLKAC